MNGEKYGSEKIEGDRRTEGELEHTGALGKVTQVMEAMQLLISLSVFWQVRRVEFVI